MKFDRRTKRRSGASGLRLVATSLLSILLGAVPTSVRANGGPTTYLVTSLGDAGTGSGTSGDLRYCLTQANTGPKNAQITVAVSGTIVLASGELPIATDGAILGPGADQLTVDAHGASRIFAVSPGYSVSIAGLSLVNGSATTNGGGIFNDRSILTIRACTLRGNHATGEGGAIYSTGRAGRAALTIIDSTVSGNSADGSGGAIFNESQAGRAELRILNSTVSANSTRTKGGGIFNQGFGGNAPLTILNCTLNGNSGDPGGALLNSNPAISGSLTIDNTLLGRGARGANYVGLADSVIISQGRNLADDRSAAAFAAQTADLRLGPLAANGGPTFTHALLPGSPAIDAGDNALLPLDPATDRPLSTDQRGPGHPRALVGSSGTARVDLGAFEVDPDGPAMDPASSADVAFTTGRREIVIDVLANDVAPTPAPVVEIATPPAFGTAIPLADGTVRYTPRGDLPFDGDQFTYRFRDHLGAFTSAQVSVVNFLSIAGRFDSLVGDGITSPNDHLGYLTLAVTRTGRLTAALTLGSMRYGQAVRTIRGERRVIQTIAGQFDTAGRFRQVVNRTPLAPLTIDLRIEASNHTILGTVSSIDSPARSFSSKFTAIPSMPADTFAGNFTMLMEPTATNAGIPSFGTGFAGVKVTARGEVRTVGTLPDGSPFTSGTLLRKRDFALFSILSRHRPRGSLSGYLNRGRGSLSNATGALRWLQPERPADNLYPQEIDLEIRGRMIRYQRPVLRSNALQSNLPPATAQAGIMKSGSVLAQETVTIDSQSRVGFVSANPTELVFHWQESSGLFSGSFLHPPHGEMRRFRGIALQGEERAGGFFLDPGTHDSGSVFITTQAQPSEGTRPDKVGK